MLQLTNLSWNDAAFLRLYGFTSYASGKQPREEYLNSFLTFTTREEYIAWRAAWKEAYKQLTLESRQAKRDRKLHPDPRPRLIEGVARDVRHLRHIAWLMLELRKGSKLKAQAQYRMAHIKA